VVGFRIQEGQTFAPGNNEKYQGLKSWMFSLQGTRLLMNFMDNVPRQKNTAFYIKTFEPFF
jgi:hypothetical protein